MSECLTADESRIGRAAIGWTEQDLADAAQIPLTALQALEAGSDRDPAVAQKVRDAFAAAGISFFKGPQGEARMRARTLDGIIDAPVTMATRISDPSR